MEPALPGGNCTQLAAGQSQTAPQVYRGLTVASRMTMHVSTLSASIYYPAAASARLMIAPLRHGSLYQSQCSLIALKPMLLVLMS